MSSETNFLPRPALHRLFAPNSVAVVGASATEGKVGHQAVLALADFPGEVFPINPTAPEILGRKSFRSFAELNRPVDLVLFALPAPACVEAVREAITCGCGAGLIFSSGFSEAGPAGADLQAELGRMCKASGFRLLGPNTAGFVNKTSSLTATFVGNANQIPSGGVAVVAQSAGVNFTVSFQLEQLGFGASLAVGLGNAVDVGAADVLEFLADHAGTRAIALHLEGLPEGRRLYEVIRRVARKKPIAALTVGRDQVGEFARSHTGNLLGSYAVRRAALSQAGAVVVDTTDELAAAAAVLCAHRLPAKKRSGVGLLTAQAGPALLALDQLKSNGVSVPALAPATIERIAKLLPPMTHIANPVDTGRPSPVFGDVLRVLVEDDGIDLVAAYALHEPAALSPTEIFAATVGAKPVLFATQGPQQEVEPTISALLKKGMFVARSPSQLAHAATVLVDDAAKQVHLEQPIPAPSALELDLGASTDEYAVKRMLERLGVRIPRGIVAHSHDEAYAGLRQLTPPLAVKILDQDIAHKTELGGVQLNVKDEVELGVALARIDRIATSGERRYLIEEMALPGLEVIVGAIRDESFGPTVMVGLGGIQAEALKDTSTRIAPLSLADADAMLDELRASALFDGWRGGPPLDRAAVARTVVLLGNLLCTHTHITEVELNPLRVYETGALALDAKLSMH